MSLLLPDDGQYPTLFSSVLPPPDLVGHSMPGLSSLTPTQQICFTEGRVGSCDTIPEGETVLAGDE